MYGPIIWQIPVEMTTNGYSGCTRHFPIKLDSIFIGMEGVTEIADDMLLQAEMKRNMTEIS